MKPSKYAVRLVKESRSSYIPQPIIKPADVTDFLKRMLTDSPQEKLIALHLNGKNEITGYNIISVGLMDRSLVHPRETFQAAILSNAAAIILAHNHPSGQLVPSDEDRKITNRLRNAGELIGIQLLDHVIVTCRGYYSFKEHGEL
ncbi:MAG: JAB domain-containing protein [Negativicutes bacterium]